MDCPLAKGISTVLQGQLVGQFGPARNCFQKNVFRDKAHRPSQTASVKPRVKANSYSRHDLRGGRASFRKISQIMQVSQVSQSVDQSVSDSVTQSLSHSVKRQSESVTLTDW